MDGGDGDDSPFNINHEGGKTMSRFGAKCPECDHGTPRSLGQWWKGVDDLEEIEETYVCDECQIVFKRTGKVTWNIPRITERVQSSTSKVKTHD